MEGLGMFGVLLVILGVIGMIVMFRGRRPRYTSGTETARKKNQR